MSVELIRAFLLKTKGAKKQSYLSDLFKSMDKDHSKKIDYGEFKRGLFQLGLNDLTEAEIRKLFNEFDTKQDGKIDYTEFMNALRPTISPIRQKAIDDAFKKYFMVLFSLYFWVLLRLVSIHLQT
jgi:Ca2+-binding EF-hand superfamily protein